MKIRNDRRQKFRTIQPMTFKVFVEDRCRRRRQLFERLYQFCGRRYYRNSESIEHFTLRFSSKRSAKNCNYYSKIVHGILFYACKIMTIRIAILGQEPGRLGQINPKRFNRNL